MNRHPVLDEGKLVIRPYSKQQLARAYHVCTKTITRWMVPFNDEVGTRQGLYYNIRQVTIIVEKLGMPDEIGKAA